MGKVVMAIFSDRDRAEDAISNLEAQGYDPSQMSFIMKDKQAAKEMQQNTGADDVVGGAMAGATTGAVVGGIAGILAGTVFPGLAGFLIGGPIGAALGLTGAAATTVSGITTGVVAGGIIGALTNAFDLSDDDADTYQSRINEGGVFVAVPARAGEEKELQSIMSDYDADNIRVAEERKTSEATHRNRSSEESSYAYAGAKGGSTDEEVGDSSKYRRESAESYNTSQKEEEKEDEGQGWHGDSKHHAQARKGKHPHHKE